ncbi:MULTISPECIES: polysaccharide biosynthesis/export family protein [unclassified Caballeronia]|uniref:polysaccharide biosynthesis/export family protein n=1 Tax=unclassified Caballeronia TaxID=2646786 RepID=UPI0020293AD6|nr:MULTISPECIES: polysaccharide biosynthesis/export family protein [unclassified Caballeronia]MDR5786158.1 polysaccharide biosynthesis/export family protein [Caballeronia sp. LP003]MDR5794282.1 polysaccharide biosynthesis/export family protein [Caballeronia sp. LZ008]
MKQSTERVRPATGRASFLPTTLTIALTCALSACAFAPGFHMNEAGSQVEATAATPAIAVTELDLALVKRYAAQRKTRQDQQAKQLFGTPGTYTVGPGDVLQIVVWDHPEFAAALGSVQSQTSAKASDPAPGFVVDQQGKLRFPYAGSLAVAGLRTDEIQQRLTSALSMYLVKPQVTVRMASYRSRQVFVDGQVHNPGALALTDVPLSFYDAIARAGGFSDNADQSDVVLVRGGASHRIDVPQLLAQGLNPSTLYLKSGDLLRVASRDDNVVYVMGEVSRPGRAAPRRDGRMSLADALAQAGSINPNTADTAQMFVIRPDDDAPQVFHLDSRSPVSMLVANEFELQPKDIVYVDGSGLVRFNRVISLLMPLVNAGLTAGVLAK